MKYIKYRLLKWLLKDLCNDKCGLCYANDYGSCSMKLVLKQARWAWKIEEV